jgi:uncharacterized protein (TIGR03083 family)
MTYPSLDAFDGECGAFAGALDTLAPGDFGRASNCPPWSLHELVVHTAWSLAVPDRFRLAPNGPRRTAADYYRRPERDSAEYRMGNVERTRAIARDVPIDAATDLFHERWKAALATFAGHAPDDAIDLAGGSMTAHDYLLTRLMSVAAHGVDAAVTLQCPAWTTPQARAALRPVLVDLLSGDPPMHWSDQDLLEFGTGRRPLRDADARVLGALRARFPLLS